MNNFIFIFSIIFILRYIIDIVLRIIQSNRNEEVPPLVLTLDEKILLYFSITYFFYYLLY
jgi:hypothetical protein